MSFESVQHMLTLQNKTDKIRNISIIAHVDHGKTTLCDSLLAKAGLIAIEDAGEKHAIALRQEEKERQITIKSTGISLPFEKDGEEYLINLVDSPGHVDFSSEVTAALRITDGAVVVVDCVEGVCVQTETVTRQALSERIKPVLHINKVDRGIMELKLSGEELYQRFNYLIDNVNHLFATYQEETLGELVLDPRKGAVSFGSGKQGWAFTLPQFANVLAKKMKRDPKDLLLHMWGDEYYDPETNKFTMKPISKSGKPLERYVVQMVFNPLVKLFNVMISGDIQQLNNMLPKIGIKLHESELQKDGHKLIKAVMQKWLPAADALIEMIIDHLPSPRVAQRYRVENLYTGPLDDEFASAIRACDPTGPVMMFVSKMIDPKGDGKRFYAFGRVFSGTIRTQQEVYILGPNYVYGEKTDLAVKKIPGLALIMGSKIEGISEIPCGNTIAIQGLEKILIKSGSITSSLSAYPISPMKFSVSPVVRRAVSPTNLAQLKKFTDGLKRLEKIDPCLQVIYKDNEFIVAGAGELHIEVALKEFQDILGPDVAFTVSPPVVEFCETISQKSTQICLGKSPNKHNRLYFTAQPLGEEIINALEKRLLDLSDLKQLPKQLEQFTNWDRSSPNMKIWKVCGTNILVDLTHGLQYLNEIKDSVSVAFEEMVNNSILCGEPLRGVRFNLIDAVLHSDTIHRGPGQIIPTTRRVLMAALLASSPTLYEPIYLAEIQTKQEVVGKIYSCIAKRRGRVIEEIPKHGTPLCVVRVHIPVMESFGFTTQLREETSGMAFPQLVFDHWEVMEDTSVSQIIEIRKRKNMTTEIPQFEDYNDKL
jgi:elongation factor 2